VTRMTSRRPLLVGSIFLCVLVAACVITSTGSASAAAGKRPDQSRQHLILLLIHPSAELAGFVKAVSDPSSPQYRQFLGIGQLEQRFGASPQTQQAVRRWLRSRGLHGRIDPTGTFVDVTAPAAVERTDFPMLAGSRSANRASSSTARREVPAILRGSVAAVIDGDARLPRSADEPTAPVGPPSSSDGLFPNPMGSSATGRTGTPSGCPAGTTAGPANLEPRGYAGFTPNQYLTAYGFDPLLNQIHHRGNERLALIEIGGGFKQSDLNAFAKCFGIRKPNINVIALPHRQQPTDEATLDVEVAAAAAPDVKSIEVYEAPGTLGGVINVAAETLRLRDRRPNVESSSYGLCEPEFDGAIPLLKAINWILEFDAAAGITVMSAAGDTGSTDCSLRGNSGALPVQSVDFPGSSPYATSVGGLNMTLGTANHLHTEVVWNNSPIAFGAGGGGTSLLFTRPWYQSIQGAATQRSVPDVSMLADNVPGYAIYCTPPACPTGADVTPGWHSVGGTSAATPLLAGGVADADQIAAAHHRPPIGFLNPLLYALGRRSGGGVLRDVTVGNNDLGNLIDKSPTGCCTARTGYDRASGLGSVNVAALARSADRAYRRAPRISDPKPVPRGSG
jgi:subtilase family serine protease